MSENGKTSAPASSEPADFEPRIVAFFCNWCTYTASDLAGTARMKYAPNARVIRVMCSGRLDPQFVLRALSSGADGVLVGGCHPNDCHYIEGNYKALRRITLLKRMLKDLGVEEDRLRLEWISASEGDRVQWAINDMVAKLKPLGPLSLPARHAAWDEELEKLEHEALEHEALEPAAAAPEEVRADV